MLFCQCRQRGFCAREGSVARKRPPHRSLDKASSATKKRGNGRGQCCDLIHPYRVVKETALNKSERNTNKTNQPHKGKQRIRYANQYRKLNDLPHTMKEKNAANRRALQSDSPSPLSTDHDDRRHRKSARH